MNRLLVRLVLSHVMVAVLGGLATFLLVRVLAPTIFDHSMMGQGGMGRGMGTGSGQGPTLREQVVDAVDQALVIGVLVGGLAAAAFGSLAAYRLTRPLESVRSATRALAAGRYTTTVPLPREHELAELAGDINLLGSSLAETESRRTRLLGEVAHEMRTPLTVIDGYVEAMIDGVVPVTPERLGQVSDEVRRLRRLSEDLSALSRSEEGRLDLHLLETDLSAAVGAAVERLRPQADDAEIRLVVTPSSEVAVVDADRVAQVVTNLVGNAIAATPPGGTITVACTRDAEEAVITVTDTGAGLETADLDRVFERFYRARPGSSAGTGVGLTIARAIVRAHGGDLRASSAGPGLGATFTVRLPREAGRA